MNTGKGGCAEPHQGICSDSRRPGLCCGCSGLAISRKQKQMGARPRPCLAAAVRTCRTCLAVAVPACRCRAVPGRPRTWPAPYLAAARPLSRLRPARSAGSPS
jgi:hypothetical protein